jgi:small-conductance mechanosensitive channel
MKLFFSNAEANVRILKLSPLLFSALLLGCNASTQTLPDSGMPDDAESVQADVDATGAQPSSPQADASRPGSQPPAAPVSASQSQFDQLSGRLTLMQEQLLQLRTDSQRLQEQNQMVLNRLQLLSSRPQSSEQDSSAGAAQPDTGAEQLDMAIGQLMQVLNSLDNTGTVGGEYAITTTYT